MLFQKQGRHYAIPFGLFLPFPPWPTFLEAATLGPGLLGSIYEEELCLRMDGVESVFASEIADFIR